MSNEKIRKNRNVVLKIIIQLNDQKNDKLIKYLF